MTFRDVRVPCASYANNIRLAGCPYLHAGVLYGDCAFQNVIVP